MGNWQVRARIAQTVDEIQRVQTSFDLWLDKRLKADHKGQYQTQLTNLDVLVKQLLADLRQRTQDDVPSDVGQAYAFCRQQEMRLLWVQRTLWGFYKDKFDQRDSKDVAEVLEVADDVVWSCYKEAFDNAGIKELPPIPLAYIEPYYSPQTLPRDEPPAGWAGDRSGDSVLKEYYKRLPIPVVSLPPMCLAAPWWLVTLGHEVGHHVQYEFGLVESFAEILHDEAVKLPDETPTSARRWSDWGKEIFADIYSIYIVGAEALWAIMELVRSWPADMLIRQPSYPPAVARLDLLANLADTLDLAGGEMLGDLSSTQLDEWKLEAGYQEQWRKEAADDVAQIKPILEAGVAAKLGKYGPMRKLSGWNGVDFTSTGLAGLWLKAFRKGELRTQQRSLRAARMISAAALARWHEIVARPPSSDQPEPDLPIEAEKLKKLLIQAVDENRDDTTRADLPSAELDIESLATGLSKSLAREQFREVS